MPAARAPRRAAARASPVRAAAGALDLELLCDVADDAGDADDLAVLGAHRRERERDVYRAAVLAPAHGAVVRDRAALEHLAHEPHRLVRAVGRGGVRDRPADRLFG